MPALSKNECNSHFCNNKIYTDSDFRKSILSTKKQIISEGITDFENDERFKKLTQCKTNVDVIFDENRCKIYTTKPKPTPPPPPRPPTPPPQQQKSARTAHPKKSDMVKDYVKIFKYPYIGDRDKRDRKDSRIFPYFTMKEFLINKYIPAPDRVNNSNIFFMFLNEMVIRYSKEEKKFLEEEIKKDKKEREKKLAKEMKEQQKKAEKERKTANKTQKNKPQSARASYKSSDNSSSKKTRCPKGTRRNKKTGNCEAY